MRELPVVDERLCIACADCVEMCPEDCLAMSQQTPWLIRPAACTSCSVCVYVCPVDAIELRPLTAA